MKIEIKIDEDCTETKIISVIMLPIAYVTNWMKHTVLGVFSYVAIFAVIFVAVWLSQYLLWKRKIKKMNAIVSKEF